MKLKYINKIPNYIYISNKTKKNQSFIYNSVYKFSEKQKMCFFSDDSSNDVIVKLPLLLVTKQQT